MNNNERKKQKNYNRERLSHILIVRIQTLSHRWRCPRSPQEAKYELNADWILKYIVLHYKFSLIHVRMNMGLTRIRAHSFSWTTILYTHIVLSDNRMRLTIQTKPRPIEWANKRENRFIWRELNDSINRNIHI